MDWSHYSIPAMRPEARFGDRVVPAFRERPNSLWAMISEAATRNPEGEALVCGERRMTWREVAQQSAQIAAGLRKIGVRSGDRVALLLGNRIEFVLTLFGFVAAFFAPGSFAVPFAARSRARAGATAFLA